MSFSVNLQCSCLNQQENLTNHYYFYYELNVTKKKLCKEKVCDRLRNLQYQFRTYDVLLCQTKKYFIRTVYADSNMKGLWGEKVETDNNSEENTVNRLRGIKVETDNNSEENTMYREQKTSMKTAKSTNAGRKEEKQEIKEEYKSGKNAETNKQVYKGTLGYKFTCEDLDRNERRRGQESGKRICCCLHIYEKKIEIVKALFINLTCEAAKE